MVFCNQKFNGFFEGVTIVTILILIDGFLQFKANGRDTLFVDRHNPYFNRWFSAIKSCLYLYT